jgi:hypothetical protein
LAKLRRKENREKKRYFGKLYITFKYSCLQRQGGILKWYFQVKIPYYRQTGKLSIQKFAFVIESISSGLHLRNC